MKQNPSSPLSFVPNIGSSPDTIARCCKDAFVSLSTHFTGGNDQRQQQACVRACACNPTSTLICLPPNPTPALLSLTAFPPSNPQPSPPPHMTSPPPPPSKPRAIIVPGNGCPPGQVHKSNWLSTAAQPLHHAHPLHLAQPLHLALFPPCVTHIHCISHSHCITRRFCLH